MSQRAKRPLRVILCSSSPTDHPHSHQQDWIISILIMAAIGLTTIGCGTFYAPNILGYQKIPNFLGLPRDHAIYYLEEAGLAFQIEQQEVDRLDQDGLVVAQLPNPGSFFNSKKSIIITIAIYPRDAIGAAINPSPSPSLTLTPMLIDPQVDAFSPTLTPSGTLTLSPNVPLSTSTLNSPTPQGGGHGQIAYASNRSGSVQIWLINPDGSGATPLTDITGGACQPSWSPDGNRLVFTSPCDGNRDTYANSSLWLVNADGTGLEALPSAPGGDYDPAWSPDGNWITFTSIRDNKISQIYLIDLRDRSVKNLSNNAANEMQPDWAPDSRQIVYVSPSPGSYTIFIRVLDTGKTRQFSRETDRNYTNPIWSPDGTQIISNLSQSNGVPVLFAANLEDVGFNTLKLFSLSPMPMRDANFSPDGLWVAFESWLDGINHDIWIGVINGDEPQCLSNEKSFDFDAAWQP